MKKLIFVYAGLIIALILLAVARGSGNFTNILPFKGKATAEINGKNITLTVARSDKERVRGLSGTKTLPENQGMLFIFDKKDKYGFWMKGMQFPIDIIYLDDNTVIDIVENAPAPTGQTQALTIYKPDESANRVLELNAGKTKDLGIKDGTKIKFKGI